MPDLMLLFFFNDGNIWIKVFKKGPSKICGRQPLKNFTLSILEYFDPFDGASCILW